METKIYYGEKPLYICDKLSENLEELLRHPDVVFIDELSARATKSILHEIKKNSFHAGILFNADYEKLRETFFKHFKVIEAAGGIVQNERKEILLIFRRGKWDLPKGKIEKNEAVIDCAQREIEEETGVKKLVYNHTLNDSFHIYDEFGKHFLKINHWFYFNCSNDQDIRPQAEEDITDIKWFKTEELTVPLTNTYPAIRDLIIQFIGAL